MRPRWPGVMGFVCVGFTLAGALFLGLGVRGIVTTQRFLATASAADGVVVKVDYVTDKEGTTSYYPIVRFVTASGQVVQYRDPVDVGPGTRVGDSVRVLYDPTNPQRARLEVGRWTEAIVKIIVGVVFLPLGLVFLVSSVFARESPRERRSRGGKASVRGGRRRTRPTPPRSGAEPNRPPHREPAEDRPQDSKVQDE